MSAGSPIDRRALARAISALENDKTPDPETLSRLGNTSGHAMILGITGAPGAGKSTLVGALITSLRRRNSRVAVLAVDPSSPVSGGALLGDRIRMASHGGDDAVFVRSLASRGHLGGLSRATHGIVSLMARAGFDAIIVETVGTGQSEVEIMSLAPTVILVCAPGQGDEIQAMKAGIMEIAHILVVNKADLPGAERTRRQLFGMAQIQHRPDGWTVPVMETVALTGQGVDQLLDAARDHGAGSATGLAPGGEEDILQEAERLIRERLLDLPDNRLAVLSAAVRDGTLSRREAAERALAMLEWNAQKEP